MSDITSTSTSRCQLRSARRSSTSIVWTNVTNFKNYPNDRMQFERARKKTLQNIWNRKSSLISTISWACSKRWRSSSSEISIKGIEVMRVEATVIQALVASRIAKRVMKTSLPRSKIREGVARNWSPHSLAKTVIVKQIIMTRQMNSLLSLIPYLLKIRN